MRIIFLFYYFGDGWYVLVIWSCNHFICIWNSLYYEKGLEVWYNRNITKIHIWIQNYINILFFLHMFSLLIIYNWGRPRNNCIHLLYYKTIFVYMYVVILTSIYYFYVNQIHLQSLRSQILYSAPSLLNLWEFGVINYVICFNCVYNITTSILWSVFSAQTGFSDVLYCYNA